MAKLKAPSGLAITRNGKKFTFSWKLGKHYTDQSLEYRTYNGKKWSAWHKFADGKVKQKTTSKTVTLDLKKHFTKLEFRVRGDKGKKHTNWVTCAHKIEKPPVPAGGVSLNSEFSSTYSWSINANDTNWKPCTGYIWQTVLVKDCNTSKGEKVNWKKIPKADKGSSDKSWSGYITREERGWTSRNYSYTRWVRVCAKGPAGNSDWRYIYHTYARSLQTTNVKAELLKKGSGGSNISVDWTTNGNFSYPVNKTIVNYTIVEPGTSTSVKDDTVVTNIFCPSGASWTSVNDLGGRKGDRGISFPISTDIPKNMAMFVRVDTIHDADSSRVEGVPVLVENSLQSLSAPTGLSVVESDPSTRRFTVSATDSTGIASAFMEVLYRTTSNPAASQVVGIIPPGESSVTCQLPEWPEGDEVSLGVRSCVGDYSPATPLSGVNDYVVTPKMQSKLVWGGGAVPLPPGNPKAVQLSSTSIQASWDWSWADANGAELTWSDHRDAWESTNGPSSYTITNVHASKWIISDLDVGEWFVRIRLFKNVGDTTTFGTYSEIIPVKLSAAPDTPHLVISEAVVPETGTIDCYWAYVSNDGTGQLQADITEAFVDGDNITYLDPPVASTNAAQHLTLNVADLGWKAGDPPHYLVVRVTSISGESSVEWSKPVPVTVADKVTATITETSLVTGPRPLDPAIEDETHSGDIVTIDNDENIKMVKSLAASIEPIQDLHGYDKPWVGGAGKNLFENIAPATHTVNGVTFTTSSDGVVTANGTATADADVRVSIDTSKLYGDFYFNGAYSGSPSTYNTYMWNSTTRARAKRWNGETASDNGYQNFAEVKLVQDNDMQFVCRVMNGQTVNNLKFYPMICAPTETSTTYEPYSNICPISGHTECETTRSGVNVWDEEWELAVVNWTSYKFTPSATGGRLASKNYIRVEPNWVYYANFDTANTVLCGYSDNEGNNGRPIAVTASTHLFTVPSDCHYLKFGVIVTNYGTTYNHDISINYPSTDHDYHAYQGTTHTTEFEGYYTKTSEDATPYTKRIAELDGDRLREKIVGGTIAWNQLGRKAAFLVTGGTITTTDGVATFTANATGQQVYTTVTISGSHKYIASIKYKTTTADDNVKARMFGKDITGSATTTWQTAWYVHTSANNSNNSIGVIDRRSSGFDAIQAKEPMLFDLTQMFGSTIADYIYSLEQANAGAGVAYFKSLFPNDYYDYNAGELKSVENVSAHRTGKNLLSANLDLISYTSNGITFTPLDNNAIRVSGTATDRANYLGSPWMKTFKIDTVIGTNYTVVLPSDGIASRVRLGKGEDSAYVASLIKSYTFTAEDTVYYIGLCVLNETTIDEVIYPMVRLASIEDDTYEPYGANTYPLDSTLTLRGIPKLDSSNQLYYDGDTYESDGTVTRKYGIVDLGTLNWFYESSVPMFRVVLATAKSTANDNSIGNILCTKYPTTYRNNLTNSDVDKAIAINARQYVGIKDTAYTDASAFKTAMNGVQLVYELATPTTESAEPFTEIQKVVSGGIEEYVTDSIVPVGHQTEYLTRAIFGGTLDVVSGVLTVTDGFADLGTFTWQKYGTYSDMDRYVSAGIDSTAKDGETNAICSIYPFKWGANGFVIGGGSAKLSVFTELGQYSSVADFKTAMSGVQLCYELATPQTYQLTPQEVELLLGQNDLWTDHYQIEVTAGSQTAVVNELTTLPLTVTATGAGEGGITRYIIERNGAYHLDRPDETDYQGYDRETIAIKTMPETEEQTAEDQVSFNLDDLIGRLDDGAQYRLIAEAIDSYGQSATADPIEFRVNWGHQAVDPTALVEPDRENLVTFITPQMPELGYEEGDTCDIYRLSADMPELIVANAQFGTKYVDPYPTLGRFGGHRVVYKTRYDDYITADYGVGWEDYAADDPAYLMDVFGIVIDFDGEQLILPYDVTVSNSWEKDFIETKYLGGAIQGDWNPAVSKTASLTTNIPIEYNPENIEIVRRLAVYPGACHVRTPDGSSYTANVTVKEDREERMINKLARISLDITRIDPTEPDGMTYREWAGEE